MAKKVILVMSSWITVVKVIVKVVVGGGKGVSRHNIY